VNPRLKLTVLDDVKRNQFGIKTLFFLMIVTAFSLALCQHLASVSDEVFVLSLVFSIISAFFGLAMIGVSIFFAVYIAMTDHYPPLRRSNFEQCYHMLVFGLIAIAPLMLLLAASFA